MGRIRHNPRRLLGGLGSALLEAVYPPRCAGCGRRGVWVCRECEDALPRFHPPWCHRCGTPAALAPCSCPDLVAALTAVRSYAPFDGWLRGAIVSFKYHDEAARADHLGRLLAPLVAELGAADGLVPVPLHPRRHRQRGYNQSALIAQRVAATTGLPILHHLARTRATAPQVGLDGAGRRANLIGAFALAPGADVRGRRLILVDDVLTTGSTLGACATALTEAGAMEVRAVTLAREI